MNTLLPRLLTHHDKVTFTPMTRRYGRAEFTFCVLWKDKILDKIYITPEQQPDAIEAFLLKDLYQSSLFIDSWVHKGIDIPHIWQHGWCNKHGCSSIHVYVPSNSNFFKVFYYSTDLMIMFDHTEAQPQP